MQIIIPAPHSACTNYLMSTYYAPGTVLSLDHRRRRNSWNVPPGKGPMKHWARELFAHGLCCTRVRLLLLCCCYYCSGCYTPWPATHSVYRRDCSPESYKADQGNEMYTRLSNTKSLSLQCVCIFSINLKLFQNKSLFKQC